MNRTSMYRGTAGVGALALFAGLALSGGSAPSRADGTSDPYAHLPTELRLTGVVRDFREKSVTGGHADFERDPTRGFAHYAYQVADQLDADGKPVFSGTGRKVTKQWKDMSGRNIMPPREHLGAVSGGQVGAVETIDGGSTTTADAFAQWFRDVAGVNLSAPLEVTLVRQAGSNVYSFDDRTDPLYSSKGGFFPINGQLYGNSVNSEKNFHFTYELETEFVYDHGAGQVFTFRGDDDVWVFIDGKCVIDLGGVHGATTQAVELDRLSWLQDGGRYKLKFFFAERHRTQSNFKIETTLQLENVELPTTAALYD